MHVKVAKFCRIWSHCTEAYLTTYPAAANLSQTKWKFRQEFFFFSEMSLKRNLWTNNVVSPNICSSFSVYFSIFLTLYGQLYGNDLEVLALSSVQLLAVSQLAVGKHRDPFKEASLFCKQTKMFKPKNTCFCSTVFLCKWDTT